VNAEMPLARVEEKDGLFKKISFLGVWSQFGFGNLRSACP
jgi:hypothetical protein